MLKPVGYFGMLDEFVRYLVPIWPGEVTLFLSSCKRHPSRRTIVNTNSSFQYRIRGHIFGLYTARSGCSFSELNYYTEPYISDAI